jgi:hypothetical protein
MSPPVMDATDTPQVNHELEARAQELCGRLLMDRWLPKRNYRDLLLDDDLRASVQRRLGAVGLQLVESFTSDYFAVRLKRETEADVSLDWATNTRMPRGAVALLVIVWAKLVLPKRIATTEAAMQKQLAEAEGREVPTEAEVPKVISVQREALYAEFGRKFGKTAFARYLGQLKSAGFVREDRQGRLREGPLLDLLVDGVQMAQKLRDSVLWDVLERGPEAIGPEPDDDGGDDADDLSDED